MAFKSGTHELQKLLASSKVMSMATIGATFGAIGVNFWFNRFPPTGKTIAFLANTTYSDALFIPANYAFAIWGLIYCGLIAFSIYQLQSSNQNNPLIVKTRPWFILASILQSLWVYTFIQEFLLASTLIIVALLFVLIQCYQAMEVGIRQVGSRQRWFLHHPFSLYLAWISVATVVNFAILFKKQGLIGFGIPDPVWTVVMMGIAAIQGVVMLGMRKDWIYSLVVIWALLALVVRYTLIPTIAFSGIALIVGLIGIVIFWLRFRFIPMFPLTR